MAFSINEANSVSTKYFDKVIRQQVYDSSAFYAILRRDDQIKVEGGNTIQFPIRYRKYDLGGAMKPRQQFTFQNKETRTGADLPFTYYGSTTVMHWDERRSNKGKAQIIDLMADKAEELVEDLVDDLCTALFAATVGTNEMQSLHAVVDSSTTYAGIATTDAAAWAATEDSTTTVLQVFGENSLSEKYNACTFGKNHPTLHITTRDLFSAYEGLLQPQQRYTDKKTLDLGFDNLKFKNSPVVGDAYCTAKAWFGLDMSEMFLCVDPDYNLEPTEWFELREVGFINALAKAVSWAGNLKCRRRKTNFKFTALDYTL